MFTKNAYRLKCWNIIRRDYTLLQILGIWRDSPMCDPKSHRRCINKGILWRIIRIRELFHLTVVSERFITSACTVCILLLHVQSAFCCYLHPGLSSVYRLHALVHALAALTFMSDVIVFLWVKMISLLCNVIIPSPKSSFVHCLLC